MKSSVLGVGETRQYVDKDYTAWVTCLASDLFHVVVRCYSASRMGKIVYDKHVGSYVASVKAVARYVRTGISTRYIVQELDLSQGPVAEARGAGLRGKPQ